MTRELSWIYLKIILELGTISKVWFWAPNDIFQFFGTLNFQFSSKTQFLGQYFEDLSCRICSYGPYGTFAFSVKNDLTSKFPSSFNFFGKSQFLRLMWKWINFLGVCSEKPLYVRGHPAGAFVSQKYTFLQNLLMPLCSGMQKFPFSFQCHDVFLRVGFTKYCKLQCKMLPGSTAGAANHSRGQ